MTTLHDRLRELVAQSGMSEAAASKACGLSMSTIRKILAGETSPTERTIAKLAAGLGSTPQWLGFGAGDPGAASTAEDAGSYPPPAPLNAESCASRTRKPSKRDTSYIQVSPEVLHRYVSGALQSESIPEEQADAYADAVLELIKGRTTAHVVLRLEE